MTVVRTTVLVFAIAIYASAIESAFGVNIIVNPGFETGTLAPWTPGPGGTESWNVTSVEAQTGTYSATAVGNTYVTEPIAPVPADSVLEFSFWIKQPEAAIASVIFLYDDATSNNGSVFPVTSDWEFFDVTSSLVSGKNLVGFQIYGYGGAGPDEDRTYLDNVTIELISSAIPEPSTLALAAFGLMGLVFRRRRRR